jgi:glycerol-3-phosphate dehydrogenase (NAD(P)+)
MIGVVGAGAFGTALAVVLGREGHEVRLWARAEQTVQEMQETRRNEARLPGISLPETVVATADIAHLRHAEAILLTLPMQSLGGFLAAAGSGLGDVPIIACCKGIDLSTLRGPTALILAAYPRSVAAILTGPSFAADIARGLPTALTLACVHPDGEALQHLISTPTLRLYRTTDVIGAELGGALKNVIAIAAGVVIGAGLGDSARAALMTRGYAEMLRLGLRLGARPETMAGLSGFGDLVLTCTSAQSRNFRYGAALGAQTPFDAAVTVEGAATAIAVANLAASLTLDMPITSMVASLINREVTLSQAVQSLLSRPLKQE